MKCLLGGLCVYGSLILGLSFPLMKSSSDNTHHGMSPPHPQHNIPGFPDRCDGLGFDAITLDEKGVTFYFRDEFLWKGFNGTAEFINNTWPQLPTHIDAAIRIHHRHAPEYHDRMFFFKGTQVYQYYGTIFEGKFLMHDKFPGIPNSLDAAMECPVGECAQDSVLFFKGDMVYQLNLNTTTVKARSWSGLGHCGAALRWLERDYCFDGTNFTRFHPSTGHIPRGYPKDARDYFMRCEGRGHGTWNNTAAKSIHNRCSNESFEEFNEDEIGRMYAFRNNWYFRLDTNRDGWHPWPIHSSWPSLHGNIDGVFSWDKKMYFIQGSQLFIYKTEAQYTLIEGYPKDVLMELGIPSTGVDATFICPGTSLLYVILGNQVRSVNLQETPRTLGKGTPIVHPHVDGAICNIHGVHLFIGTKYYKYDTPNDLVASKSIPDEHSIRLDFMNCAPSE